MDREPCRRVFEEDSLAALHLLLRTRPTGRVRPSMLI